MALRFTSLVVIALTACAAVAQAAERVDRRANPAPVIDLKPAASPQQMLELLNQIEELKAQMRQMQDRIEVQGHAIDQLKANNRDLLIDLDRRVQTLEQRAAQPPVASTPPPPAVSGDDQQQYDAAFALMKQGEYERALKAFQAFVGQHPNGPLADNAQYWMGEGNYVLRDFDTALTEFTRLVQNFPASPKIPDAMLKIGYCHQELGHADRARKTLEDLARKYPNSSAAKLAQKRLEAIAKDSGKRS